MTVMQTMWLAMDIGCIECGEDSQVIGVFNTEAEAKIAIEGWLQPGTRWGRKDRGGQHSEEVFEIQVPLVEVE